MIRTKVHRSKVVVGIVFAGLFLVGAAQVCLGVSAAPIQHELKQPDGTIILAKQWGDEFVHGWETADGYTILQDPDTGWWSYATVTDTGELGRSVNLVGNKQSLADLPLHLRPSTLPNDVVERINARRAGYAISPIPSTGTNNVAVFLINFSNTTTTYTPAQFQTLLFGTGTNSMKDFYQEVSYGAFSVTGSITKWYTATNTHNYYGSNDTSGYDVWPGDLVYDAVHQADVEGFNFAPYDQDGDCYVDVVNIIHQGTAEEAGGPLTDIWSHSWDLSSALATGYSHHGAYTTNSTCTAHPAQKVIVNDYVVQPEVLSGYGISTVGVFCHEYGHALGLPDLYDTGSPQKSEGDGNWTTMAAGSWCYVTNPGDRPSHFDPWCKKKLGWISPALISGTTTQTLHAATSQTDIVQFRSGTPGDNTSEYFFVETRGQEKFDAGLPGWGLLVWHVDEKRYDPVNNGSNNLGGCKSTRPCTKSFLLAVEQADGSYHLENKTNRGNAGDPFPGSSGKTTYDATTTPTSKLYNGTDSGLKLCSISYTSAASPPYATVTFGCKKDTTTTISSDTPDPSVVGQAYAVTVAVATVPPGGSPTPTGTVTVSDGAATCTVTLPATSCNLTSTTVGSKNLTATYNGDTAYNSSTSSTAAHTVNKASTSITVGTHTPNPSVVGQAITVNFTLSVTAPGGGTPTGTVTVSDGTTNCTATLPATSCAWTPTSVGDKSLTATYSGNTNYNGSTSSTAAHTVNKASTTIAVGTHTPNPSVVGQAITVNFTLSVTAPGSGTPTGTVTVGDGTTSCTATLPATSCAWTPTSVGAKSLTATYAGNTNYNGSTSGSVTHTVNKASTSITVGTHTPNPSVVGQAITVNFTLSVTAPGSGTPTGTVTISDGTTSCTATLPATSCAWTPTTIGSKSLTASYAGNANFNSSTSGTSAHTVNKANTSITVGTHTPNPSVVGQAITVNFTLSVTAPGSGTPTGTVTISDGTTSCTATLPAASCAWTPASVGSKNLTASYGGDTNYNSSTSGTSSHTVNKASTTIAVGTHTPNPSVVGQAITVNFTLSVTAPGSGTPTGTVTLSDGTTNCTATLPATSCAWTPTTIGSKNLTASYAGDTNFNSSTSGTSSHTVNKASTTIAVGTHTPNPSVVGQAITVNFTLSVTAPGSGTPTGTVTLNDGTTNCTATLPATSCNWTPSLTGTRTLTATYAGDANFLTSVSAGESHTVIPSYTLSVTKTGSGTGKVSSSPAGIDCGTTCSAPFASDTVVDLTSTASLGSTFTGWSGACTGNSACQVTMSDARSVTANFNLEGSPSGFYTLTPCRVFDTREVTGPTVGVPVSASDSLVVKVTNTCGIPDFAMAISANVTVVNATQEGDMEVIAGNLTTTSTSTISVPLSRARANNAMVQLATDSAGTIKVINHTSGTVHVILDVNGYFQ